MEFSVLFYATQSGDQPIVEFLDELEQQTPTLRNLVIGGIRKLKNRSYHRPPLTELVDSKDHIYELRVGDANIARVFFFFQRGQEIILTNGYIKKRQKLDAGKLALARQYKKDWEARFP